MLNTRYSIHWSGLIPQLADVQYVVVNICFGLKFLKPVLHVHVFLFFFVQYSFILRQREIRIKLL